MSKSTNSDNWKFIPPNSDKKKNNIFDRFVDKVRSSFQRFQKETEKDKEKKQLIGRIQDLHVVAGSVLTQLESIKDDLKENSPSDVFPYVQEVVDPIIREVSKLHKSIDESRSITQQAKTFQRYSQWIDKAKLWVQIYSNANDKEAIEKGIIYYMVEDFLEVIDRDLQVVNDYQEHMLDTLALDDEEKVQLVLLIEKKLDPYVRGLNDLKTRPKEISLHEIAVWKAHVDKRREKYFDATLHAIDKIINQAIPDIVAEDEHDHLVDVLSQIVYLEHEAPDLYDDLYITTANGHKLILLNKLENLEQEVDQLFMDLRLTPDLIDRLQAIADMLKECRKIKDR